MPVPVVHIILSAANSYFLCIYSYPGMRSIKSHAMVLAASNENHTKVRNHIRSAFHSAFVCFKVGKAS
jgi:hypothetical protein